MESAVQRLVSMELPRVMPQGFVAARLPGSGPVSVAVVISTMGAEIGAPSLVIVRELAAGRVLLGALVDAQERVLQWLEVWVQSLAAADSPEACPNGQADRLWVGSIEAMATMSNQSPIMVDRAGSRSTPFFVVPDSRGGWTCVEPRGEPGHRWELCTDDARLQGEGLPCFDADTQRYLHVPQHPDLPLVDCKKVADAAWRVTPVGVKHLGVPEQSLACNPCGGYLCVRPLVVYSLADFLTMLRERVEGTAEGFPVSSNGTCDPWLLRGAANRRSRAIEAMHLKLRLLRDAVSEVRAVVHRTGAPLLNLSDSSFRVTLPDEAPGLPRLWNARCVLAHPGEGVRVTVHGSEKAYFRPGPSHTSSVWKPGDVVGRFVSAATNFAVTKARTEREGVVLEGLLRRSTMDLRAHDLVRLIFTWASARYEVWAQVQQVGGGPDVEVTTIPYKDAGLLRDIEGSRTKVECLVMPIVSSPFDLYSLAVLGVFMLLVEDPSRFNKTKVLLENLAERCALLASEDAQAPLEARIARTLASDAGLASFLAQAAPRPIPEDLWLGSIAMLIRALPESGPDSSCANPRDVPAHALHTVFDPLLSDLDRLLARTRTLVLGEEALNREVCAVIQPHLNALRG